jgi:Pyridoxamine 5'-phosphate oxidase
MTFTGTLDSRFSQATEATPWPQVHAALAAAERYWITTVRADGRPHVTPLVGIWVEASDGADGGAAFVFCTGPTEQKARNLENGSSVAVTTGVNTWQEGLDIVVEGAAARVMGKQALVALADLYRAKYGDDWSFDCDDEVFDPDGEAAMVFRVTPSKVLAFAKSSHGQTRFHQK